MKQLVPLSDDNKMTQAALLVVDSCFLPSQKPLGTFAASKEWYSAKHGEYSVKYQFLHTRDGKFVTLSSPWPGKTSDIEIYEKEYDAVGDLLRDQEATYSILADKG